MQLPWAAAWHQESAYPCILIGVVRNLVVFWWTYCRFIVPTGRIGFLAITFFVSILAASFANNKQSEKKEKVALQFWMFVIFFYGVCSTIRWFAWVIAGSIGFIGWIVWFLIDNLIITWPLVVWAWIPLYKFFGVLVFRRRCLTLIRLLIWNLKSYDWYGYHRITMIMGQYIEFMFGQL